MRIFIWIMSTISSKIIKEIARQAGFDLCGITAPDLISEAVDSYKKWLDNGYQAEMNWLNRNIERRTNPGELMDNIKSLIMLGMNYYTPDSEELPNGFARVSKYARGKDYHKVFKKKIEHFLHKLESHVEKKSDHVTKSHHVTKWWVDYGPFMERAYAVKAGLGYIGKNSMLINKDFGSWVFLAEIVTTLEIEQDSQSEKYPIRCGSCRLCIDACPTGAIVADGVIDSNKCISYVTVEAPENLKMDFKGKTGGYIFGCDICQNVCPHNISKQIMTPHKEFTQKYGVGEFLEIERVQNIKDRDEFLGLFAGTALVRPKEEGMKRNAKLVGE